MTKKSSNFYWGIAALLLCSTIWGTSFVAQSLGGQVAEPFTFNCVRNAIATLFLIAIAPLLDKLMGRKYFFWGTTDRTLKFKLYLGGTLSGLCLAIALFMQQWGIMYTSAGKSGFITALYIVLVPLFSFLFFSKKITKFNCLGVLIATIGMYFICLTEELTITKGDFITLACPILFSLQILIIDYFIAELDGVRYSMLQFAVCSLVSGFFMIIFEQPTLEQITAGIGPILYLGIMSSGIAYTLQIIGQKFVDSLLASMLMSLESVFALISGWLYLQQTMTIRELTGCALMVCALMIAQIPEKN